MRMQSKEIFKKRIEFMNIRKMVSSEFEFSNSLNNDLWTFKSIIFFRTVAEATKKMKNIGISDYCSLDRIIELCNETGNEDMKYAILSLPGVGANLEIIDEECYKQFRCLAMVLMSNLSKPNYLKPYRNVEYANGYEYLSSYSNKEGKFYILYREEILYVESKHKIKIIKDIIEKEKLTDQGSLLIAEMLAI